jgi:hypothetical protein
VERRLSRGSKAVKRNLLGELWDWNIYKQTTNYRNNKLLITTDEERRTVFHMAAMCGRNIKEIMRMI